MNGRIQIFCGGPTFFGKELASLRLACGLRDAGWFPEFITSKWNSPEVTTRLQTSGFNCQFLWLGFISATLGLGPLKCTYGQLVRWPELVYGFRRLTTASRPRVVIHTNWHHALLLLPVLDPSRDIYWLHEILPSQRRFARVFGAIASRVGRIVCVSAAVARSVLALGIPKSKITMIHSGIALRDPLPIPGSEQVLRLGIVGQIGAWKGHEDLLDAVALLSRAGAPVLLSIFGSGDSQYVEALRRKVLELQIVDKVRWCGYMGDQADLYRDFDVCVVPSRCEEALGMSAIEASGFGRPVICSSRGGLPEIVKNGETGFVVEPERSDKLAEAIAAFANQRHLVSTMGEAARKRVQNEFSMARFVRNFVQVVEEVGA
jgi:glycosyltransferase involved in cell wall biosynthesis